MNNIETFSDLAAEIEGARNDAFDFRDVGRVLSRLDPGDTSRMLGTLLVEIQTKGRLPTQAEDHIYLYRRPEFSMLLRFAGTSDTVAPYAANEFDAYLLNLSHQAVEVPAFACSVTADTVGQRPEPLRPEDAPLTLRPNAPQFAPAFGSILDLPAAAPAVPVLVIHSQRRAWTTWVFDRATLAPVQRVSTDLQASRIQLSLKVLAAMEVEGLAESLERLAVSDYAGFARWDAVKHLYAEDPQRARDVVARMAQADPDPELRRAARTTLQKSALGA